MLWQHPEETNLSPLATVTCRLLSLTSVTPALDAVLLSMKLWVEPESKRAMRWAPLMETSIAVVQQVRDYMPVSA
jgi:hypothetical protein